MKKRIIAVLTLSIIGIGVSGYLTFVELSGTSLYCVEGFSCLDVLASTYSRIAGVPISLLGLLMYLAISGIILIRLFFRVSSYTLLAGGLAISLAGTIFSAYLTFVVEAVILGKFCFWCVTSAITITAIAVLFISLVLSYSNKNASGTN